MKRPDLRTVPRYFLNPSVPGFANGRAVRIVDLSVKGARIELLEPFQPGEQIFLVMVSGDGEITVPAIVLWSEIDTLLLDTIHDRYLTGVAFLHPSSTIEELLDDLLAREAAIRIEDFRDYDRYRVTAPLTGSFGDIAPVSVLDLSVRGARIGSEEKIGVGSGGQLRFQVDGLMGLTDVYGKVVWTAPTPEGTQAGVLITGEDEKIGAAIQTLCVRGEARIDVGSLRRKFDQLRAHASQQPAFVR